MNSMRELLAAVVAVGSFAFAATTHAQQVKEPPPVSGSATLKAEAKVSEAAARATALKEVPNGVIQSGELEREDGKLIYSFDIKVPGKSGIEEVEVDAMTGAVVEREHETQSMEQKDVKVKVKEKDKQKEKEPAKPY